MQYIPNMDLCARMGLNPKGQMRVPYDKKNLYWTFEGSHIAFGYGDLDKADYDNIRAYLSHPSHEAEIVFLGWNEHHGTQWEQTAFPIVRITAKDGVSYPALEARRSILRTVQ